MAFNKMVISIGPDGKISHTLKDSFFKPDLDTKRACVRMSEILHHPASDKFYVRFLGGEFQGKDLNLDIWKVVMGETTVICAWSLPAGRMQFETYEQAVEAEVQVINAMRLKGIPVL